MDIQQLRENLAIKNGKVTITSDTVTGQGFADFFAQVFGSTPIVISDAKAGPDDAGNTVQVSGTASEFHNVQGAPITATFVLDPTTGIVAANLNYTLVGDGRSWKFTDSFPNLPITFDFSTSLSPSVKQTSPLDDLDLRTGWFVATTGDLTISVKTHQDSTDIKVGKGLNFVGSFQVGQILQVFESIFGGETIFAIGGPISIPTSDSAPNLPDKINAFPTLVQETPPGITLTAPLGFSTTLGKALKLDDTTFSIYSPIDSDWQSKNPGYAPYQAFHCAVEVPSAKLRLDLSSKVVKGMPRLVITGEFTGFTLANLADLVDLAGTNTLIDQMPADIRALGSKIGELQLIDASISLNGSKTGISIEYVDLSIGMPDLDWSVGDGLFTFISIVTTFTVTSPFKSAERAFSIVLDGHFKIESAPIEITASAEFAQDQQPAYFVTGELEQSQTIPLTQFFKDWVPELQPAPGDLSIDTLTLNIDLGEKKFFNFATEMAKDPPWDIHLGSHVLTIEDVEFGFNKTFGAKAASSANVSGSLIFDTSTIFTVSYNPQDGFVLRGTFPTISLADIIGTLIGSQNVLPSDFTAIKFEDSSLALVKTDAKFQFNFGTQVFIDDANFGSFVFVFLDEGSAGFAIGLDLKPGQLAKLPGLSAVGPFLEIFTFVDDLVIIASTIDDSDFEFPQLSLFKNPKIESKEITIPKSIDGLQEGFYFYASTKLSNNKTLENLAKLLDISPDTALAAGIFLGPDPATNAKLFVTISTEIANTVELDGTLGLELTVDGPAFYMTGTAKATINKKPLTFDVTLVVTTLGAFIGTDLKVGAGQTIDFSVFKLKAIALEAGISFEDELPSLGFFAELDVSDIDSSISVYVNTADPAQSLVAGSISDINLAQIVDGLSGAQVPTELEGVLKKIGLKGLSAFSADYAKYHQALNTYDLTLIREMFASGHVNLPSSGEQIQLVVNQKDALWFLVDLATMNHYELRANEARTQIDVALEAQMYFVPVDTQIATIPFKKGFHVTAEIDFVLIKDKIAIEVLETKGIGIDFEMSPISIGSPDLFSITGADGKGGPQLILSTFDDPTNPIPAFRKRQFIISADAHILGINPHVDIEISEEAFHFHIGNETFFGAEFNLNADITGLDAMCASGSASVTIGDVDLGDIGSVPINTGVDAGVGFGKTETDIYANAHFDVEVEGNPFHIGPFDLDIKTGPFKDMPKLIAEEIAKALIAFFKKDARKWLEWVKSGFIKGIDSLEAIGKQLKNFFGQSAKEAAILFKAVGYSFEDALEMLLKGFGLGLEEAEKILNLLFKSLPGCASASALIAA